MGFEKRSIKKVPTWVARLPVVLGIGVSPVLGQLHLITGYPTTSSDVETYSSSLLRVGSESGVTRIAELASQAAGTQLIDISYDRDLAVVFTGKGDALAIDLYKGIVAKECHTQGIRGRVTTSYWLADDPGKGLLFDWYMTDPSLQHPAVRGLILDVSVPCEGSTVELAPSDIRYVVAHGSAAVAGLVAPFSPIIARLDEQTELHRTRLAAPINFPGLPSTKGAFDGAQ